MNITQALRGRWIGWTCGLVVTLALSAGTQGAAQGENLLDEVEAAGVVRVALTLASPPWSFLDAQNQPAGYDVDVANELARRMGVPQVEFIRGTFQNFILGVESGRFDMVVSGQTITEERQQQVDFSIPYQVNGVAIFVRSDNAEVASEADLAGRRVAVTAGSTQETFARESIPDADVRTYETATLALRDVAFGRADAALYSRFVGAYLAEENGLNVKPLPGLLNSEVNAISFAKGQAAFKEAVDQALTVMINDGTLTDISRRWLGGQDMAAALAQLEE